MRLGDLLLLLLHLIDRWSKWLRLWEGLHIQFQWGLGCQLHALLMRGGETYMLLEAELEGHRQGDGEEGVVAPPHPRVLGLIWLAEDAQTLHVDGLGELELRTDLEVEVAAADDERIGNAGEEDSHLGDVLAIDGLDWFAADRTAVQLVDGVGHSLDAGHLDEPIHGGDVEAVEIHLLRDEGLKASREDLVTVVAAEVVAVNEEVLASGLGAEVDAPVEDYIDQT